jgi:6,7-dimethyl-8-ribityllumazine synthase
MASAQQNLSSYDASTIPDAAPYRFGIVLAEWNADITHVLYDGCLTTRREHGAQDDRLHTVQVPGTFELPAAARMLAGREKLDAVICLGCVIKGETKHDEYIANAVSQGLVNLSIATGKPYIFGVLTPNTHEQARDRAGGKHGNKGVEAAITAIRMAELYRSSQTGKKSIGFGS